MTDRKTELYLRYNDQGKAMKRLSLTKIVRFRSEQSQLRTFSNCNLFSYIRSAEMDTLQMVINYFRDHLISYYDY